MRTKTTRTTRAAVVLSGAVAALVLGGAAAPAAYADAPGKAHGSHGKKIGQAKKSSATSAGKSKAGGDNRASSNKDGKGHNDQWQAQSDPDGMENGGIDQPGGNGGYDPKGWDGNNGTGNDPDCEDDNRGKGVPGHCKDRPAKPARAAVRGETPTPASPTATPTVPASGFTSGGSTIALEVPTDVLGIEQFASSTTAGRAPAAVAPVDAARAAEAVDAADTSDTADTSGVLPNTGADAAMLGLLAGGLGAAGAGTMLVRRGRASES